MSAVTDDGPTFPDAPHPSASTSPAARSLVRCRPGAGGGLGRGHQREPRAPPRRGWRGPSEPATEAGDGHVPRRRRPSCWDQRHDFGYSIVDAADEAVARRLRAARPPGRGTGSRSATGCTSTTSGEGSPPRRRRCAHRRRLRDRRDRAGADPRARSTTRRSARVPEKLGYTFDGRRPCPTAGRATGRPTQVWLIDRDGLDRGPDGARRSLRGVDDRPDRDVRQRLRRPHRRPGADRPPARRAPRLPRRHRSLPLRAPAARRGAGLRRPDHRPPRATSTT